MNSTRFLRLTLFAESHSNIIWYVDASHQLHANCKGHIGSLLTFGRGATTSSSTKHKIPSKSSCKSEIVGLYDKVGDVLWTRQFLEAQGYKINTNIVYQDNMSTLSLAKNGYVSNSKRTKHVKAKYFFICHFHHTGELDLGYCSTEQMWADVLTKPLQGAKFHLMHAFLMNCPVNYFENQATDFIPTSTPTSTKTKISTSSKNHSQPFVPTDEPTDIPMKKRSLRSTPSSRGCVETQAHGTKVPVSRRTSEYVQKTVTWRDAVLPRHLSTTSRRLSTTSPTPCTAG